MKPLQSLLTPIVGVNSIRRKLKLQDGSIGHECKINSVFLISPNQFVHPNTKVYQLIEMKV